MKLKSEGNKVVLVIEPGDCPPGRTPEQVAQSISNQGQNYLRNPMVKIVLNNLVT